MKTIYHALLEVLHLAFCGFHTPCIKQDTDYCDALLSRRFNCGLDGDARSAFLRLRCAQILGPMAANYFAKMLRSVSRDGGRAIILLPLMACFCGELAASIS